MADSDSRLENYDVALAVLSSADRAREPIFFELCRTDGAVDSFVGVFLCRLLGNPEANPGARFGTLTRALKQNGLDAAVDFPRPLTDREAYRLFFRFLSLRHLVSTPAGEGPRESSEAAGRRAARTELLARLEQQFREYDRRCVNSIWRGFQEESDRPYLSVVGNMDKPRREPDSFEHLCARLSAYLFEAAVPDSGPGPESRRRNPKPQGDSGPRRPEPESRQYRPRLPSLADYVLRFWPLAVFSAIGCAIYHLSWGWALACTIAGWGLAVNLFEYDDYSNQAPKGFGQFVCWLYLIVPWPLSQVETVWGLGGLVTYPLLVLWVNYLLLDRRVERYPVWWIGLTSLAILAVPAWFAWKTPGVGLPDSDSRPVESARTVSAKPDRTHYDSLKQTASGLCWRNLQARDVQFLTASDLNALTLQFNNVLNRYSPGVRVLSMSDLRPNAGMRIAGNEKWEAKVRFSQPVYTAHSSYAELARQLGLVTDSVKLYVLNYPAGEIVPLRFYVDDSRYTVSIDGPFARLRGAQLLVGPKFDELVGKGSTLLVEKGSPAQSQLDRILPYVKGLRDQMAADRRVMDVDPVAKARYEGHEETIRAFQRELIGNARRKCPMSQESGVLADLLSGRTVQPAVQRRVQEPTIPKPRRNMSQLLGDTLVSRPGKPRAAQGKKPCPICGGRKNTYRQTVCPTCHGTGLCVQPHPVGKNMNIQVVCPGCRGARAVLQPENCRVCGGRGTVDGER